MSNEVKLVFAGDASNLSKTFDSVGSSSRKMAAEVDKSSEAHTRLGERIGSNEGKFMGAADLLDGLGGAFGLPTEGATKLFRGLGDLSGGFEVVSGIMPAITGLFPGLSGAMTMISSHPLIAGILIGGAIIGGLILLEKKFGLVSDAVHALGDGFRWAWENGIKPALNAILGGVELWINAMTTPMRLLSKLPGIPDLPMVHLPRLDIGGTVLQTGIAVVHRGEHIYSAGSPAPGGGNVVNVYVYGTVIAERDLVDTVHAGLLDKQRRSGSLGLAA